MGFACSMSFARKSDSVRIDRLAEASGRDGGHIALGIDLSKAFHQVYHSAAIQRSVGAGVSAKCAQVVVREVVFARAHLVFQGVEIRRDIKLARGISQGSPLSGLLFIVALTWGLQDTIEGWNRSGLGLLLGQLLLSVFLNADEMLILARSGEELRLIFEELKNALSNIGLSIHHEKRCYLTNGNLPSSDFEGVRGLALTIRVWRSWAITFSEEHMLTLNLTLRRRRLECGVDITVTRAFSGMPLLCKNG